MGTKHKAAGSGGVTPDLGPGTTDQNIVIEDLMRQQGSAG